MSKKTGSYAMKTLEKDGPEAFVKPEGQLIMKYISAGVDANFVSK